MTMLAAEESPCGPAALAAAVRTLAHDAHRALKGPRTEASLAELARRIAVLKGWVGGRPSAPLGHWLDRLAATLENARTRSRAGFGCGAMRGREVVTPRATRKFPTSGTIPRPAAL